MVCTGKTPGGALKDLVEKNYQRVSRLVFQRARWRCEECRLLKPLQAHHKVFRSQGRLDTEENLRALCAACHDKIHNRRSA